MCRDIEKSRQGINSVLDFPQVVRKLEPVVLLAMKISLITFELQGRQLLGLNNQKS